MSLDVAALERGEGLRDRLAVEELLQTARERTGLSDYGRDQSFRIGLAKVVEAIEATAPSPYLRADAGMRIAAMLETRLRMVEDARLHPEIEAIEIKRPLIIAGLPRTGTTISFDLLSLDPAARFPREWEWLFPWPAPEVSTIDDNERGDMLNRMNQRMVEASPEITTIHRFDAYAGGECNGGMMHHFSSANFVAEFGANSFVDWLVGTRAEGQYADHKRLLQQFSWKGPHGRWLLKSPQHLFDLPGLLDVYPDARIVWTHRDPVATFSSLSNYFVQIQRAVKLESDPVKTGAVVSRLWGSALLRAVEAVEKDPRVAKAVLNLPHAEIVRDPIAAVRTIYDHFEEPFSAAFEQRLASFTREDEKAQRYGRHRHSPQQSGLDPDRIRADLAPYYARFGALVSG